MNSRQFAAAHDRYLDPPDEEDEDDNPDEDALHDIRRQRKLDEEDWIAEKIRQKGED